MYAEILWPKWPWPLKVKVSLFKPIVSGFDLSLCNVHWGPYEAAVTLTLSVQPWVKVDICDKFKGNLSKRSGDTGFTGTYVWMFAVAGSEA